MSEKCTKYKNDNNLTYYCSQALAPRIHNSCKLNKDTWHFEGMIIITFKEKLVLELSNTAIYYW